MQALPRALCAGPSLQAGRDGPWAKVAISLPIIRHGQWIMQVDTLGVPKDVKRLML